MGGNSLQGKLSSCHFLHVNVEAVCSPGEICPDVLSNETFLVVLFTPVLEARQVLADLLLESVIKKKPKQNELYYCTVFLSSSIKPLIVQSQDKGCLPIEHLSTP